MQFNVAQLLKEPLGFQWGLEVNEEVITEWGERERVEGHLVLTLFNEGIWAEASLNLKVDEVCGRCLKAFRQPIRASINEQFYCETAAGRNDEPELMETEDGDLYIDDTGTLDLSEVLRQHLILNRPVKSICHPDCNGICPLCGGDSIDHWCQPREQCDDPRWTELAALGQSKERG